MIRVNATPYVGVFFGSGGVVHGSYACHPITFQLAIPLIIVSVRKEEMKCEQKQIVMSVLGWFWGLMK